MNRAVNLSIAQNAQPMRRQLADHTGIHELLRTDFGSLFEPGEIADIDCRKLFSKRRVGEPPLWDTPMQWHLAPLESAFLAATRTGPHTFTAACRRFSVSRAGSPTDAFCFMSRTGIRP